MTKSINVLTGKTQDLKESEIIVSKKRTDDYIISIPHSGEFIPTEFADRYNLGKSILIGSDLHTDKLYDTGKGIMIVSRLNNYFINMSRLRNGSNDPNVPKRLRRDPMHGLSLTKEPILVKDYSAEEMEKALKWHDLYHNLIKKAIEQMKKKHGYSLMFDCHSMNSVALQNTPDKGKQRPDFVIGTLDDTSADKRIIDAFEKTLKKEAGKLTVAKNFPFSGGFITRIYGNAEENVHVIQLEVNRKHFMQEGFDQKTENPFTLNQDGLKKINSIISKAFDSAAEQAKKL